MKFVINKIVHWSLISLLFGCASSIPISSFANSSSTYQVIKQQEGTYPSPSGRCEAIHKLSDKPGGFFSLTIVSRHDRRSSDEIEDITGMVWISENELLYTVSPIYGKPGIFIFDCKQMKTRRILGPKTIDKAYPDGADYFELKDFSQGKIYFYYAPDVDLTAELLYQVNLDGTGFRKVVDK